MGLSNRIVGEHENPGRPAFSKPKCDNLKCKYRYTFFYPFLRTTEEKVSCNLHNDKFFEVEFYLYIFELPILLIKGNKYGLLIFEILFIV